MVAFNKIEIFVEDLANAVHDLDTHQLTVSLHTEANKPVTTDNVLADVGAPISYTNLSARTITFDSDGHTTGTYKILLTDLVLTAGGGSVATFRHVLIYNSATAVKTNPLIMWYDHGSDVTLADGETFTIDFDGSAGWFTLA